MPTELQRLQERARKTRSKNSRAKLNPLMVPLAIYRGLVTVAEQGGVNITEAHRWVLEEGLKAWDVRVRKQPSLLSRAVQFNRETPQYGAHSVKTKQVLERQARAAGISAEDEGLPLTAVERMTQAVTNSGAMGKVPADLLTPGTSPVPTEKEDEDMEPTLGEE